VTAGGYLPVALPDGSWTLQSLENGEVFHPTLGDATEARILYLEGGGLEERLRRKSDRCTEVWDVGFGAGGNAAAVVTCWNEVGKSDLILKSFDRDLSAWNAAMDWKKAQPDAFRSVEILPRFPECAGRVAEWANGHGSRARWDLVLGDFVNWVGGQLRGGLSPDVVMYDFYSPEASIREWTLEHWQAMRRALAEDAKTEIVFHTRSTAARVTLLLAGFYVAKGPALGQKEETTRAMTAPCGQEPWLGPDWLERVKRSTKAGPIRMDGSGGGRISEGDFNSLRRHPQFQTGFQP
jgi:hypothetical protein